MEISFSFGLMFLIGVILFLTTISVCDEYSNIKNKTIKVILASLTAIAFILPCTAFITLNNAEWEYPDKPYATEYIVALNDSNMINGKVYVHGGRINEDLYYQYMVALRGGCYKANKVKSSDTTIYYDTDNYRVEWCEKTKKWLWFSFTQKYNKIYIPEGSIIDDFSIDLS